MRQEGNDGEGRELPTHAPPTTSVPAVLAKQFGWTQPSCPMCNGREGGGGGRQTDIQADTQRVRERERGR